MTTTKPQALYETRSSLDFTHLVKPLSSTVVTEILSPYPSRSNRVVAERPGSRPADPSLAKCGSLQKKPIRRLKVACIGAGYVGAPTSCVLARQCPHIDVVVLDLDEERVQGFMDPERPKLPIYEPGLDALLAEVRNKNLIFSSDCRRHIADADVIFVAVNTPTKTQGVGAGYAADLSYWEAAGRQIAECSNSSKIIVEKSTVPVKTASALKFVLSANAKPGVEYEVLSNPEFLAEGTALKDLMYPDRVLIGGMNRTDSGRTAMKVLVDLYSHWVPREKILLMDTWSSELSKLCANAFLAQRISSINSVAMICEKIGADVSEVSRAIGHDTRIGSKFLQPSVGFGGSCFKKDIFSLVYLCKCLGLTAVGAYWESVIQLNEVSKSLFKDQIVNLLFNTVKGKSIGVFGYSFKKDTSDVRETPAAHVCYHLLLEGAACVNVYDPMVARESAVKEMASQGFDLSLINEENLVFTRTPLEAAQDTHGIAVLTEWDEFKTYDYKQFYNVMKKPAFIFDGRLVLDHNSLREIGFYVKAIGKQNEPTEYEQIPGPLPR